MSDPFRIDLAGVNVELGGNTVVFDKDNRQQDQTGEFFDFFRSKEHVSHTENYAVLDGEPENGVTIKVLEYLSREMVAVPSFSEKNGVKKFSSKNDLYVVFSKNGEHRIYVVCHRKFATGAIIWQMGMRKKLPVEVHREKPFADHLDLAAVALTKPGNGNGQKPSEKLDQATKDAIAEKECDHGFGKSGKHHRHEVQDS